MEPFQVSFYIRDAAGLWRWNYLEHEDNGWRSAEVTFSDGKAHVSRNGKPFSDIPLPLDTVDVANLSPDQRDRHLDAGLSAEDVLRHHSARYR